MLGAAIIVLRETLEAALLIGIIAAATRAIPARGKWISGGIVLGLAGAAAVALLAGQIAVLFGGVGQELFNAAILAVAVAMLAWHQIWMSAHGAELAAGAWQVGNAVREGSRQLSAVLVVVAIAVLREGAETALFLYGLLSGGEAGAYALAGGALVGVAAGALLGVALYAGLLRIPMKWLFGITGALIVLLAAGMASRMTHYLIQADIVPGLANPAWDSSFALPADSAFGVFMHALVGYEARPAGMQVVAYTATFALILGGMWWVRKRQR